MDERELMEKIKFGGEYVKELECQLTAKQDELKKNTFTLLDELQKIKGWDAMIIRMYGKYLSNPDKFFEDCKLYYTGTSVQVYMTNQWDESFLVMVIVLYKSLQEQVDEANEELNKKRLEYEREADT